MAYGGEGVPSAPGDLAARVGSASHVDLAWSGVADAEEGFLIEMSAGSGPWREVGRVPAGSTGFQSVGLLAEGSYRHRVCSVGRGGRSEWAVSEAVRTPAPFDGPRGKVIVASSKEFPRNGEGSFASLKDGTLAYCYGAWPSTSDAARGTCLAKVVSTDSGETWSQPAIILRDPRYDLYHPCMMRAANGSIGMAYTKRQSGTHLAEKVFRSSLDEGATWSDEVAISDGQWRHYITGAHDRLVRLASGRLLIPVFMARLNSDVVVDGAPVAASLVFASDDNGRTWTRKTPDALCIRDGAGQGDCEEPCIVETAPGRLLMVCRTARGWLYESRSADGGDAWSGMARSSVANPRAPARLEKIPGTDRIVMVRNPHVSGEDWHKGARLILASQVSRDAGLTWEGYRQIEYDGETWYDYPSVLWVGHTLHVAYRAVHRRGNDWQRVDVRYVRLALD